MLPGFVELSNIRRRPEPHEYFMGATVSKTHQRLSKLVTLKELRMKNGLAEL
jgi:hypothetical protein